MQIGDFSFELEALATPLPMWRATCPAADWSAVAQSVATHGGRLLSLWGSDRRDGEAGGFVVSVAYASPEGLLWLDLLLDKNVTVYPDISGIFPYANRMQRTVGDLLGVVAESAEDRRPWLNHGTWPATYFPLRQEVTGLEQFPECAAEDYPFVRVEGDGVHEIAVGPVHAGIIEPGHFRFSVVGERVLRLEERLGLQTQRYRQTVRADQSAGCCSFSRAGFRRLNGRFLLGLLHGAGKYRHYPIAAQSSGVEGFAAGARRMVIILVILARWPMTWPLPLV